MDAIDKLDSDDKWHVDVQTPEKLPVPSFIRLFMIRRILGVHIDHSANLNHEIEKLVLLLQNMENYKIAKLILSRLINDGIKEYMANTYDDQTQSFVIEAIFNEIIMTKFTKEYQHLTKYVGHDSCQTTHSNMNDFFQTTLWNTDDLMCLIFQFLDFGHRFDDDLFHCSLVNSHWLYHVWNLNSIYKVDLERYCV